MIDFLRANTWCSLEEYKWKMTVGQIRLSSLDFSHIEYLDKKNKSNTDNKGRKMQVVDNIKNLSDLGVPIIDRKGK